MLRATYITQSTIDNKAFVGDLLGHQGEGHALEVCVVVSIVQRAEAFPHGDHHVPLAVCDWGVAQLVQR